MVLILSISLLQFLLLKSIVTDVTLHVIRMSRLSVVL